MMFTKMVVVPPGETTVSQRIETEIRKEFLVSEYEVKNWRSVKTPHLPTPSGTPYWVTLWEVKTQKK